MKRKRRYLLATLLTLLMTAGLGVLPVSGAELQNPEDKINIAVDVDVEKTGCNSASYHIGQSHKWLIRCTVPADIADAGAYQITDTMDHRLTPEAESLTVALLPGGDRCITLEQDDHYRVTEMLYSAEEPEIRKLVITLTREGMAFIGKHSGFSESRLEIAFCASINSQSGVGESLSNMAQVRYVSPSGTQYISESDRPEVHTGGIVVRKTDSAGNPLAGACFRIARAAEADGGVSQMLILEEEIISVVYQRFFDSRKMRKSSVAEVVTNEEGIAVLYGLAYGTYYIVETKAPEGYNLLTQPIAVIIDETSHLTEEDGWKDSDGNVVDHTVQVVNTKFVLPDSGGWGTELYTITGLWIMFSAVVLLMMNIRRHPFG